MPSIKFNFDRMKRATLRKRALGPSGSSGGFGGFGGGGFSNVIGGGGFSGGGRGNSHNTFNPVYDDLSEGSIIEQFMPVDPRRLHRIWRRIYLQDPVAGPAVELYKDLPWSDFQLVGVDDRTILRLYADALNAINITSILPEISAEFLTMGKVIGHLLMNESKGYFDRLIIHDPDWIRVTPIPIPSFQPKLDIIPTPSMRAWAHSRDERDIAAQRDVKELVELIRSGADIPLPPEQSFYIPRKAFPYDMVGASAYTRIIMFVAYEKALVNSTIAASRRRASRIRHIAAGIDDVWEPSKEELDDLSSLFMQADADPVGAIVATRTGVNVSEVGGGTVQDLVKISDEWQFLLQGKLNALGVSEAFITGESTYNSLEQSLSIFLEKVKAHRSFMVNALIKDKILKPLALKHNFVMRKQAELDHRIRIARDVSESNLILPKLVWEKSLKPVADRDYLEILGMMEEKGIPISAQTWASAAGFDLESEMEQFPSDVENRRALAQQRKKIEAISPMEQGMGGGGLGGGGLGGGGLGDLGGGLGDLGGGLGGGGDLGLGGGGLGGGGAELGGGDLGGGAGGGGLELPQVGASVKTAATTTSSNSKSHHFNADRKLLQALAELPVWKNKEFLGVSYDRAELAARRLMDHMGSRISKTLSQGEVRRILSSGHNKRDQVLRYLLSRAGILKNSQVSREVAIDLQKKLTAMFDSQPEILVQELRQVAACAASHSLASKLEEKSQLIEESAQKAKIDLKKLADVGVPGESKGNRLLTGYLEDKTLVEES